MVVHKARDAYLKFAALTAAAILAFGTFSACGSDDSSVTGDGLTKLSFKTGFTFGAWDVGFFIAQEKGYYKDAGLDVEMTEGEGSSSNLQLLATGKIDVAHVAGPNLVTSVVEGVPVKMVASFFQIGGAGFVTVPSIKDVDDLEGHRLTGTAYGFSDALFPAFKKAVGITDMGKINVAPNAIQQVFLTGKADAMVATGWGEVPRLRTQGAEFNYFSFAEYGVNTIGPGIVASDDVLANNKKAVTAFVEASRKGWQFVYDHPNEAAKIIHDAVPLIELDVAEATAGILEDFSHTPTTKGRPLGWMAEQDWRSSLRVMKDAGLLKSDVSTDSLYTNLVSGR